MGRQMVEFMTTEPDITVPGDVKTLMRVFGISPIEARFMQHMLKSRSWVGRDEFPEIKYSIRQTIYTLRRKIEPKRIWVVNDGNGRYSITPDGKLAAKAEIERKLNS